MSVVAIETQPGRKFYSFLNFAWGFIADVDIESEKFRNLGSVRFTIGCAIRVANMRFYKGRISYLPAARDAYSFGRSRSCQDASYTLSDDDEDSTLQRKSSSHVFRRVFSRVSKTSAGEDAIHPEIDLVSANMPGSFIQGEVYENGMDREEESDNPKTGNPVKAVKTNGAEKNYTAGDASQDESVKARPESSPRKDVRSQNDGENFEDNHLGEVADSSDGQASPANHHSVEASPDLSTRDDANSSDGETDEPTSSKRQSIEGSLDLSTREDVASRNTQHNFEDNHGVRLEEIPSDDEGASARQDSIEKSVDSYARDGYRSPNPVEIEEIQNVTPVAWKDSAVLYHLRSEIDNPPPDDWVQMESEYIWVTSVYLSHLGNEMMGVPSARLDDDVMYIYTLRRGISKTQMVNVLMGFEAGTNVERGGEFSSVIPCRAVRLEPVTCITGHMTVDGEVIRHSSIQASVTPHKMNIMSSVRE